MKNYFPAALAAVVLPSLVPAQSLTYVHTTLGKDAANHLRSPAWLPLFADDLRAETDHVVIDYDVTITNTAPFGVTFYSMTGFGTAPFVNGGRDVTGGPCWGVDEGPEEFVFQVSLPSGPFLLGGQSQRFTGTGMVSGVSWMGAPMAAGTCVEDGVHATQTADFRMGPSVDTPVVQWEVGATPWHFQSVDHGSTIAANEFIVSTEYSLPPIGSTTCTPSQPNSTGSTGELSAFGQARAAQGETLLVLDVASAPAGQFGFFILSRSDAPATALGGGNGTLCLGGPIVRWLDSVAQIDANGALQQRLDPSLLPSAIGVPTPGATFYAQFWHRDQVAGVQTSNTTSAVALTFQ